MKEKDSGLENNLERGWLKYLEIQMETNSENTTEMKKEINLETEREINLENNSETQMDS